MINLISANKVGENIFCYFHLIFLIIGDIYLLFKYLLAVYIYIYIYFKICLFILGCDGSSLLRMGFL